MNMKKNFQFAELTGCPSVAYTDDHLKKPDDIAKKVTNANEIQASTVSPMR
jgi:hypothetical protein